MRKPYDGSTGWNRTGGTQEEVTEIKRRKECDWIVGWHRTRGRNVTLIAQYCQENKDQDRLHDRTDGRIPRPLVDVLETVLTYLRLAFRYSPLLQGKRNCRVSGTRQCSYVICFRAYLGHRSVSRCSTKKTGGVIKNNNKCVSDIYFHFFGLTWHLFYRGRTYSLINLTVHMYSCIVFAHIFYLAGYVKSVGV